MIFLKARIEFYLLLNHVIFFKIIKFLPFPYHLICFAKVRIKFLNLTLPCDFFKRIKFLPFSLSCVFFVVLKHTSHLWPYFVTFFFKRIKFLTFSKFLLFPYHVISSKRTEFLPFSIPCIFFSEESSSFFLTLWRNRVLTFLPFDFFSKEWGSYILYYLVILFLKNQVFTFFLTMRFVFQK